MHRESAVEVDQYDTLKWTENPEDYVRRSLSRALFEDGQLEEVVGGVAVSGGRGSLWGTFVGLLLLATINPALTYLHVEAYWEKAIQGAIILLAVVADGLRNRRAKS